MVRSTFLWAGLAALWLAAVGAGLRVLYEYENQAGPVAAASRNWPATSGLRLHQNKPTLVLFAHPWCPCSRATVGELEALMAQARDQVSALVLFAKPAGSSEAWEQTSLWRSAAAIPGVTVLADNNDREAALFGAQTSGHALLYDTRGRLLFGGGITAARGHSGANAGGEAIVALIAGQEPARARTPIFGCDLHDPHAAALQAQPAWQKGKRP